VSITSPHKWDLSGIKDNFIPGATTFAYLAPIGIMPNCLGKPGATFRGVCAWKYGNSERDKNRRAKEGALWVPNLLPPNHPMALRIPGHHWELEAHIEDTFHHLRFTDWEGDEREVIRYHSSVLRWMQAVRRALHIKLV
jgi:hypothetical protein